MALIIQSIHHEYKEAKGKLFWKGEALDFLAERQLDEKKEEIPPPPKLVRSTNTSKFTPQQRMEFAQLFQDPNFRYKSFYE